ncbi:5559_t:CDS:2 [Funneliformis geosporum]|nr:5559_t:CDS:2 [Funneliformis geosporum]
MVVKTVKLKNLNLNPLSVAKYFYQKELVHQQMRHHFKEHGTMDCLFEQVEDLNDERVESYLTKTYRDYQTAKKQASQNNRTYCLMTQVIFDFKDLITHCLHDEEIEFTNAFNPEIDSKAFISELFQNLKSVCQETELKELFKKEHFHFVQNPYTKGKIERLINNPYFELTNLCQIPLTQGFRLYGNLKRPGIGKTSLLKFSKNIVGSPRPTSNLPALIVQNYQLQ